MKLFLITYRNPGSPEIIDLLEQASKKRNIPVRRINAEETDVNQINTLESSCNDIFHRQASSKEAVFIEGQFLTRDKNNRPRGTRTDAGSNPNLKFPWHDTVGQINAGLPVIPTVFLNSTIVSDKKTLREYVDSLGGYPVVLKKTGLSHGAGIQLIQGESDLHKKLGTIEQVDIIHYALRKYLKNYIHKRVIVLDGKAIDSIEYIQPEDDFRTNVKDIKVEPTDCSSEEELIAVKASQTINIAFGGADILTDIDSSKKYLIEFNSPCNFARAQNVTGVDSAGKLLDYLINQPV